jgi:hypothetical protein
MIYGGMMKYLKAVLLLFFAVSAAFPQAANVQVNRDNKTISVSADHTMSVEPEIAVLRLGYRKTSFCRGRHHLAHYAFDSDRRRPEEAGGGQKCLHLGLF